MVKNLATEGNLTQKFKVHNLIRKRAIVIPLVQTKVAPFASVETKQIKKVFNGKS